jgi:hypothetical protein
MGNSNCSTENSNCSTENSNCSMGNSNCSTGNSNCSAGFCNCSSEFCNCSGKSCRCNFWFCSREKEGFRGFLPVFRGFRCLNPCASPPRLDHQAGQSTMTDDTPRAALPASGTGSGSRKGRLFRPAKPTAAYGRMRISWLETVSGMPFSVCLWTEMRSTVLASASSVTSPT